MKSICISLLISLCCFACQPKRGWNQYTAVTGEKPPKELQNELKDFVMVHGGVFTAGEILGRDTFSDLRIPRLITIPGFYLQKYEVSVGEYMAFCRATGDTTNRPDTLVFAYYLDDPIAKMYFWHPKYANHPIVGVNLDQVNRYIAWKNKQLQEKLKDHPNIRAWYTLPLDIQMEYVIGYYQEVKANRFRHSPGWYPLWFHDHNFNRWNTGEIIGTNGIHVKYYHSDGHLFTCPVNALEPNAIGIYNLCGNVAEWTRSTVKEGLFPALIPETAVWLSDTCVTGLWDKTNRNQYEYGERTKTQDTFCFNRRSAQLLQDSSYYQVKGGSWKHSIFYTQSSSFLPVRRGEQYPWLGFRMVLNLEVMPQKTP